MKFLLISALAGTALASLSKSKVSDAITADSLIGSDRYIVTLKSKSIEHFEQVLADFEAFKQAGVQLQDIPESDGSQDRSRRSNPLSAGVRHKFASFGMFSMDADGTMVDYLRNHPGVARVSRNQKMHTAEYSWGTDRIDQAALPLSGSSDSYAPDYDGSGVEVYIVDTGIDTTHYEFQAPTSRTVENVYDFFEAVSDNNDGDGHGTHVAGTVGGQTVGVARGADIYGVKVLDNNGAGSTETVIAGLQYVYLQSINSDARQVISMSLGGSCDDVICADDATITVIDTILTPAGIVTVVAAGNDACDACASSPSASLTALTIGATQDDDVVSYYSNIGQCVDLFAPGTDITSACALGSTSSSECYASSGDVMYLTISGTSMATPHVSGVVAQWLEKQSSLTPAEALEAIQCQAVSGLLTGLADDDDVTKNLLLQTPSTSSSLTCTLGSGCLNDCSSNGLCQSSSCVCDKGWTGDDCSTDDPYLLVCPTDSSWVSIEMYDDYYYDGWNGAEYRITQAEHLIVNGTLACGASAADQYCLSPGHYHFQVCSGPSQHPYTIQGEIEPCDGNFYVGYNYMFEIMADGSCGSWMEGEFDSACAATVGDDDYYYNYYYTDDFMFTDDDDTTPSQYQYALFGTATDEHCGLIEELFAYDTATCHSDSFYGYVYSYLIKCSDLQGPQIFIYYTGDCNGPHYAISFSDETCQDYGFASFLYSCAASIQDAADEYFIEAITAVYYGEFTTDTGYAPNGCMTDPEFYIGYKTGTCLGPVMIDSCEDGEITYSVYDSEWWWGSTTGQEAMTAESKRDVRPVHERRTVNGQSNPDMKGRQKDSVDHAKHSKPMSEQVKHGKSQGKSEAKPLKDYSGAVGPEYGYADDSVDSCTYDSSSGCVSHWIGDGWCDYNNNNDCCQWDGGDCCEATCVSADYDCGVVGYACCETSSACESSCGYREGDNDCQLNDDVYYYLDDYYGYYYYIYDDWYSYYYDDWYSYYYDDDFFNQHSCTDENMIAIKSWDEATCFHDDAVMGDGWVWSVSAANKQTGSTKLAGDKSTTTTTTREWASKPSMKELGDHVKNVVQSRFSSSQKQAEEAKQQANPTTNAIGNGTDDDDWWQVYYLDDDTYYYYPYEPTSIYARVECFGPYGELVPVLYYAVELRIDDVDMTTFESGSIAEANAVQMTQSDVTEADEGIVLTWTPETDSPGTVVTVTNMRTVLESSHEAATLYSEQRMLLLEAQADGSLSSLLGAYAEQYGAVSLMNADVNSVSIGGFWIEFEEVKSSDENADELTEGEIAGSVIGALVGVGIVGVLAVFGYRRYSKTRMGQHNSDRQASPWANSRAGHAELDEVVGGTQMSSSSVAQPYSPPDLYKPGNDGQLTVIGQTRQL